jgi:hypothetical protein
MWPEISLLHLQDPSICPYAEGDESNPQRHLVFIKN